MNKRPNDSTDRQTPAPTASSRLRDLWLGSCARYTVLCLLMMVVSAIASGSLTVTYIDPIRFFLLLPFAVFLTLAAWTRRAKGLSVGAKCALHPLLVMSGFYLFCYLPFQIISKPSGQQVLILIILALLAYGIGMGIFLAFSRLVGRKTTEEAPYVSQYSRPADDAIAIGQTKGRGRDK